MSDFERGPDELAARFRVKPTKATKRYPRKAVQERLRKKLAKRMAELKGEQ